MAIPFGEEYLGKVRKDFTYHCDWASASLFELGLPAGSMRDFILSESKVTDKAFVSRTGEVEWNWVDLRTLGSCACWGVDGNERTRLRIDNSSLRLYEMQPHNVDYSHQSLSLALGSGALAYKAVEYEGREDVFADVKWGSERVSPRVSTGIE